ncbi:MAG: helical backbone metal receptor [Bryobacterales bacterium]|jgi:iron complex transport system substrate-binding protein|nr:helical backbone metal receptor [Bryobacterales bacterium]
MKQPYASIVTRILLLALLAAGCAYAQPQRIVSTSPSITETLFAIGAGPRVVGVSTYCKFPPEAQTLPRIGSYRKPDVEHILRMRPDLVILNEDASEAKTRLHALGLRSMQVPSGSMADALTAIHQIGAAAGAEEAALALTKRIQQGILRAQERTRGKATRTLMIVGRDPDSLTGLIAAGPGSYLGELLEAAGGVNVLEDRGLPAYPRISLETVLRLDPDFILDAGAMGDRPEGTPELRARVLSPWAVRKELKAVRQRRVVPVFSPSFTVPGPRMLEVVDFLAVTLAASPQGDAAP